MQKVERKAHRERKNRRWIGIAAAFVLLAGSVTAAVVLNRPAEENPVREDHSGLVIDRQAEELLSVTVARRGEEPWTLIRAEDGSLHPEDGEWTAAAQPGDLLQEAMVQLRYEEILTENPEDYRNDPEDFGLADPRVSVTARYTDGTETTVRIGNDTGLEENWTYLTADGDDRLFAIASSLADDLDTEYALLHPVPRPEIYGALIDRIAVEKADGTVLAAWELRGSITDRDAGVNWVMTAPIFCPADEEAIENLKKNAENLRLGTYAAAADPENLAACGLEPPEMILTVHMAEGSTGTVSDLGVYDVEEHTESTVVFRIGKARDGMTDYVQFGDGIYAVSRFTLSPFTEAKPMSTAARYPVLTPLESLESLTVEEKGETRVYELRTRESTADGEEAGEESTRECLLNGAEISADAFDAAYERMLTVTFSGVLPDGAEWKEAYKKYTFRTLSGGTHTVEMHEWDGLHDAVTVDGATVFYLIRGGMTALPGEENEP